MSIFRRLKSQIRHGPNNNGNVDMIGGDSDPVILPEKPKKKRKLMEVQKESKKTLAILPQPDTIETEENVMDDDDEDMPEEKEEKREPKKVPWGPPEILDHLKEPTSAGSVNAVIDNLKKSVGGEEEEKEPSRGPPVEIVWDHSQSKEGKKSDNNFYLWFETMSAGETRKIIAQENLIYE